MGKEVYEDDKGEGPKMSEEGSTMSEVGLRMSKSKESCTVQYAYFFVDQRSTKYRCVEVSEQKV